MNFKVALRIRASLLVLACVGVSVFAAAVRGQQQPLVSTATRESLSVPRLMAANGAHLP